MGERARRHREFLRLHPFCCFCGGSVPAVQVDHVPPRAMFLQRNWPLAHEFPACAACNNGSAVDDRLFAFVASGPLTGPVEDLKRSEWTALAKAIQKDHPELFKSMLMPATEKKRVARSLGLVPEAGQGYSELGLLRLPQGVIDALQSVLRKVAKALHYLQTGRIVPSSAHIEVYSYTNAEVLDGRFPQEALVDLPAVQLTYRNGKDLSDQFLYRFGTSPDGRYGMYVCRFGEALLVALLVSFDGFEEIRGPALNENATGVASSASVGDGSSPQ